MDVVNVEPINAVHMKIDTDSGVKMELQQYFSFRPTGYQFVPAYKNRVWDGWVTR